MTATPDPLTALDRRRDAAKRLPPLESGYLDPWHYSPPGPRGRSETVLHLQSAGLCPGYTVQELREAWNEAGELERDSIIVTARAVSV